MLMRCATLLTTLLLISSPLLAAHHGDDHNDAMPGQTSHMEIAQPWARATPPGAATGGGFVTITNSGEGSDTLVGATSSLTDRVEIHTMEMDGDVMRMQHLPGGVEIPAGETVTLAPGGLHLMFMGLSSPIEEGQPIAVTLEFQHAGSIEAELQVVPVGASPEGEDGDHGDHHHEAHGEMAH
ncbi:copper chaperone PCu(A)C [Halomonas sp. SpR8]|uniref:copper chaperone PCu(A)C n=1 Tax=Halomonas sp. SpR8 TaxID=3050463 RepID=UPI0027E51B33|nr:copper chaperone PCu(A)C [Halomonas sp. SpR8]MDQ7729511.1 copper chaperone PCu(A)C [Halomonas sp. SpR8]